MIHVKMPSRTPCTCYGCRTAVEPKEGGVYCINKASPWYLCCTTCRCGLRELRENEEEKENG
jgi:hypothetical protein